MPDDDPQLRGQVPEGVETAVEDVESQPAGEVGFDVDAVEARVEIEVAELVTEANGFVREHPDTPEAAEMAEVVEEAQSLQNQWLKKIKEIFGKFKEKTRQKFEQPLSEVKINGLLGKLYLKLSKKEEKFNDLQDDERKKKKNKFLFTDGDIESFFILVDKYFSNNGIDNSGYEHNKYTIYLIAKLLMESFLRQGNLEQAVEIYAKTPSCPDLPKLAELIYNNVIGGFSNWVEEYRESLSEKELNESRARYFEDRLGKYPDLVAMSYYNPGNYYEREAKFDCEPEEQLELFRKISNLGNRESLLTLFQADKLFGTGEMRPDEVHTLFEAYRKFAPTKIFDHLEFFKQDFVKLSDIEKDKIVISVMDVRDAGLKQVAGLEDYLCQFALTQKQANEFIKQCKGFYIVDNELEDKRPEEIKLLSRILEDYPYILFFDSNVELLSRALEFPINKSDQRSCVDKCLDNMSKGLSSRKLAKAILEKQTEDCGALNSEDREKALINYSDCSVMGQEDIIYFFQILKDYPAEKRQQFIAGIKNKLTVLEYGWGYLTNEERDSLFDSDTVLEKDVFGEGTFDARHILGKLSSEVRQRFLRQVMGQLETGNQASLFLNIFDYYWKNEGQRTEMDDEAMDYLSTKFDSVLSCLDSYSQLAHLFSNVENYGLALNDEQMKKSKELSLFESSFTEGEYWKERRKEDALAGVVEDHFLSEKLSDIEGEEERGRVLSAVINSPKFITKIFQQSDPENSSISYTDFSLLTERYGGVLNEEQFDVMINKLLKHSPQIVLEMFRHTQEVSDDRKRRLVKAFIDLDPKSLLAFCAFKDKDELSLHMFVGDISEVLERIKGFDIRFAFVLSNQLNLNLEQRLYLVKQMSAEDAWWALGNLRSDEQREDSIEVSDALVYKLMDNDFIKFIEKFSVYESFLSDSQRRLFFGRVTNKNNRLFDFLKLSSVEKISLSNGEVELLFGACVKFKMLDKLFLILSSRMGKDKLLSYFLADGGVRKRFIADFEKTHPLAFTGLTGEEGKGTDNVTPLLQYFYDKHNFELNDNSAEVFSGYVKEFGVSTSDVLFKYYKNIIDQKNGRLKELPPEQLQDGLDTVEKLRERSIKIRQALIKGEIPAPEEMTNFDYDVLRIETRFETSRWARQGKDIRVMHREFYTLQKGEKIAPLSAGYEEETLSVDKVEMKKLDFGDCQEEYGRLRNDLVNAHELAKNGGVEKFKQKLLIALKQELDGIVFEPGSNPRKIEHLQKRKDILGVCLVGVTETVDVNKIMKLLMKLEIDLGVKSESSFTSPFLRAILFCRVIEGHSGFAEMPNEMNINEQANLEGLQYVRDMIQNVIKQHILLTGDWRQGEEGEKRVLYAIKKYFGGDEENFPTVAEASRLAKNLTTNKIVEFLKGLEGELAGRAQNIRMIPDRGFVGELSGYYADACWTNQDMFLRDWPNITPYKFVTGEEKEQEIMGAVLFIETKSKAGEKVVIVRGLNPRDKYLNTLQGKSFCEQVFDKAKNTAKRVGAVKVLVAGAPGTTSNREKINSYVGSEYKKDEKKIPLENSLAFNDYEIQDECYLVRDLTPKS
ncbi:MAG TPA: hypothetical protein DEB09_01975 [Candidatus Magasanikbacteria bacterium]|nr:hypothetical protein [Candidatus Magasanikbacteria bacterium]